MLTAIYDGQCVLCNRTKHIVQSLDWREHIEFRDLHQHTNLLELYPFISPQDAMGAFHVVDCHQRVYVGFAGIRRMLRSLPLAWPLYAIFCLPIVGNWLGPTIYEAVAKRRYIINRLLGIDHPTHTGACDIGTCRLPE
jgi:predicted DCC family thiol-disulfide oxidoreductase YuxK